MKQKNKCVENFRKITHNYIVENKKLGTFFKFFSL